MTKQFVICLFLALGISVSSYSQTEVAPWSIGLGFGKMEHDGERGSSTVFGSPFQAQYGGRISKYMSPLLDLSLAGTTGKHGLFDAANAADQFEGSATQFSLAGHIKPLKGANFNPFLSLGLGYFSYSDDSPASVVTPGTDQSGLAIPVGLGFKYNIADGFGLYLHSQLSVAYLGDNYNGLTADGSDKYGLHELGVAINFGKKDRDGDKVADDKDECPDTPGLKELNGCPDSDMDGIRDGDDNCPDLAGLAEYNGCPDTDMDGVIDPEDKCPEVKGEARYNGCPDVDNDGVGDDVDECPEEVGLSRYNGCPIPDSDGDGFNDEDDECKDVKGDLRGCPDSDNDGFHDMEDDCKDVAGPVEGCPDADNDGIADKYDKCPNEAGVPEKEGCPLVRKPTRSEIINRWNGPDVNFTRGTRGDENYDADIDAIVAFHKQYPDAYLNISGYSDSQGSERSNLQVSKRRAKKVYEALIKAGVPAEKMTYTGYGEANPIADNSTPEGRLMNRRVSVRASTFAPEKPTVGGNKSSGY